MSTVKWTGTILKVLVICSILLSAGYSISQAAGQTVIKSTDKLSQVTIPKGWKTIQEVDNAVIQVALEGQDVYVIVMTNAQEDFEKMTLSKFSELSSAGIIEALSSVRQENLGKLTINGLPARQLKIQGTSDNNKVVYLQTVVEGKKHFHQILAQSPYSSYEKHKDALQLVIKSFKER
jgi:hypothetical protein